MPDKKITVAEFIEILKGYDQGLIVQCLEEVNRGYETYTRWKNLEKDDLYALASYLEIGSK